jgi:hypothetical protein
LLGGNSLSIQHKDIPEAQLHEPKGISTAAANQTYISNGGGSGTWTDYFAGFQNIIEVREVGDLPAPVSGVITLESNTAYFISGTVVITPNVINADNPGVAMLGFNRAADALVTDFAGPLISSTNNNLPLSAFTLTNLNASGTLLNLSNTGTNVVILDKMFFGDCASIGTISNYSSIIFDNCGITATSPIGGIVFSGSSWNEILARDSYFKNYTGTLFDLGTATTQFAEFLGVRFLAGAGDKAVDGLAAAGNIGTLGVFSSCLFSGMTNPTGNIDHADSGWFFTDCVGTQDSGFVGYASMVGNATVTTGSGTAYTKVAGTTVASPGNERFTMSADSELTFDGLLPRPVQIDVNLTGNTGGGSEIVSVTIFKDNGATNEQLDANVVSRFTAAATPQSCSLSALDTANPGDKYAVYVTSSSNVTVEDLQFSMRA